MSSYAFLQLVDFQDLYMDLRWSREVVVFYQEILTVLGKEKNIAVEEKLRRWQCGVKVFFDVLSHTMESFCIDKNPVSFI